MCRDSGVLLRSMGAWRDQSGDHWEPRKSCIKNKKTEGFIKQIPHCWANEINYSNKYTFDNENNEMEFQFKMLPGEQHGKQISYEIDIAFSITVHCLFTNDANKTHIHTHNHVFQRSNMCSFKHVPVALHSQYMKYWVRTYRFQTLMAFFDVHDKMEADHEEMPFFTKCNVATTGHERNSDKKCSTSEHVFGGSLPPDSYC